LIAGATAVPFPFYQEQNQADKLKQVLIVRKLWLSITKKRNNAIAQGFEAEKKFYEDNNRQLQFANQFRCKMRLI
jgi:hypothetical protein